jgi:hypothetical protein
VPCLRIGLALAVVLALGRFARGGNDTCGAHGHGRKGAAAEVLIADSR